MPALIRAAALTRVALAGVRERPARSLFVALAVTLGVGILGGSLVYADTARSAFFADLAKGARGIDVVAMPTRDDVVVADGIAALSGIPTVAHTDVRFVARLGVVGRHGRLLLNGGEPGLAVRAPAWPEFAPYDLVEGRPPAQPGEVALDVPTARREGVAPGQPIRVADRDRGIHELTVVGLVDFGVSTEYADHSVVVLVPEDLERYATPAGRPSILVAGEPGADQAALTQQVRAVLGDGYVIATGDDLRDALAIQAAKYVDSFLTTLRVTAIVALAATMLVVYNTFQIVARQRRQEFALMRCIGLRRGQLIRVVLLESILLGVLAAVGAATAGLAAGLALAFGQATLGRGLPSFDLVVAPASLLLPAAVALLTMVASAVIPAVLAGRCAPVSALTSASTTVRPRPLVEVLAIVAAAVVAAMGLLVMRSGRGLGFDGLPSIVGGAMAILAAILVVLPVLISWFAAPVRWLLAALLGVAGRLAADNVRSHPVRSASTAAALVIALAPMATLAVLLTTARDQAERELAENFAVDYLLTDAAGATGATGGGEPFSPALLARLHHDPAFEVVAAARSGRGSVDGIDAWVGTVEPGYVGSRLAVELREGDLAGLPSGTVAVRQVFAIQHGVAVGDRLEVAVGDSAWSARVVALFESGPLDVDALTSWSDFTAGGAPGDALLLIRRAEAITATDATQALDHDLADQPFISVTSQADRRESLTHSLERRLTHFTLLFGVSVVIGLLGIVNALFLSVAERSGESAVLRAVGLSRRQLYATLVVEALLSVAIGTAIGVAFGVGLGWVAAGELVNRYGDGATSIPIVTILAYAALVAVAAVLAALPPARRAARASPIDAMRVR